MTKILTAALLAALLTVSLTACKSTEPIPIRETPKITEFQTTAEEASEEDASMISVEHKLGVSFDVPNDWEVDSTINDSSLMFTFLSPEGLVISAWKLDDKELDNIDRAGVYANAVAAGGNGASDIRISQKKEEYELGDKKITNSGTVYIFDDLEIEFKHIMVEFSGESDFYIIEAVNSPAISKTEIAEVENIAVTMERTNSEN